MKHCLIPARTSEIKHHKAYVFRFLRKNDSQKIKKNFFQTYQLRHFQAYFNTATALKARKFKIAAEAIEKISKRKWKNTAKELLYFQFTTDSDILAQTLPPQVNIDIWLILVEVMSLLEEPATRAQFGRNSNPSHLIDPKSILCYFKTVFKLKACKQTNDFFCLF